jgi:hypothetical protein
MDNMNDIFDQDVLQASPGDTLDADLVAAAGVLSKLAEEAGVDIDSLSESDVSELIHDLMGNEPADAGGGPDSATPTDSTPTSSKEASMSTETTTEIALPDGLTYADVAKELSKVAQAENIDLDSVSREEYHEAFEAMLLKMSAPEDPEKVAQAEAEKLAYNHGVLMADGFLDRLKQAEEEEKKDEEARKKKDEAEKEAAFHGSYVRGFKPDALSKAKGIAKDIASKGRDAVGKAKGHATEASAKAKGHATEAANKLRGAVEKNKSNITHGGAAAGGAAVGAGAAMAHERSKKSELDEAAMQVAKDVAAELGLDASKLAGVGAEISETEIGERAVQLLKEAGLLASE